MSDASTSGGMLPQLLEVVERARREPEGRFHSLAHFFFDSLDRKKLKEMLEVRVADGSLMRLIGKCLHVGVLEGVELSTSETGTAQGSVLSPLLGNVYLHYALDQWFEWRVKPRLHGQATLVRYADDLVIGFP